MSKEENLEELSKRYKKHGKFLTDYRFRRMMDCDETWSFRYALGRLTHDRGRMGNFIHRNFTESDMNKILITLLNDYDPYDIKQLDKDIRNLGNGDYEEGLLRKLYNKLKFNPNLITYNMIPNFPAELILGGAEDGSLLNDYAQAIFDLLSSNDLREVYTELPEVDVEARKNHSPYSFYSHYNEFDLEKHGVRPDTVWSFLFYYDFFGEAAENKEPLYAFNEIMQLLLEKYSVEELLNNVETIQKEIRTGFIFYLPNRPEICEEGDELLEARPNIFSNNRAIFDKMIEHFDAESLPIIMESETYLSPMLAMINESKLEEEELDSIREAYSLLEKITELRKAGKYQQLLSLIEKTEEKERERTNDPDIKFCDILNSHLLNYEELMRKDIVQNTRSFADAKLTTVVPEDIFFRPLNVEAKSVEHIDQLSSTLFSFVKPRKDPIENFAMICYEYLLDKMLPRDYKDGDLLLSEVGEKTQTDLFNLTMDIYDRIQACSHAGYDYNITNIVAILNPEMTSEEVEEIGLPKPKRPFKKSSALEEVAGRKSLLSKDELKECVEIYKEYVASRDPLQPHKSQRRSAAAKRYLIELTNQFSDPKNAEEERIQDKISRINWEFVEAGLKFSDTRYVDASLLRLTTVKDFNNLIGISDKKADKNIDEVKLAVCYDGGTIPEEAIIYSSASHDRDSNKDSKFPFNDKSTPLPILSVGEARKSSYYPYDSGSEIRIDSNYARPAHLLAFYNPRDPGSWSSLNPVVSEKAAKKLEEAQRLANERGMDLIIVNCPSICRELAKKDAEKAEKYDQAVAKENGETPNITKSSDEQSQLK